MILAAGRGQRMMPLTANTPKPLLRVEGLPLIQHRIHALRDAGIVDLVINVHYLGEQIKSYLGDGQKYGVSIIYSEEEVLLETAGGIQHALPLLGDAPFLVVPSDTVMDIDFASINKLPSGSQAHLVMVDNPSQHPDGDFSILENGMLSTQGVKLTYSSVALFSPRFFESLPAGPMPLRNLFLDGIKEGIVTGEYFSGLWADIGTPERLAALN